jgi:serine phosphatase RsbU (regulator of sigma subunit)
MKIKFTLLLFLISFGGLCSEINLDSLINIVNSTTNDSQLVELYNNIGSEYYREDQNLAEQYWKKGLALAEENHKKNPTDFFYNEMATAHNGLGIIERRHGNMPQALEHYQISLNINKDLKDSRNEATCYFNIGIIYRDLKEYDKALNYLNLSLDIREKMNDNIGLAGSYNGIGVLYRRMKDYEKAIEYYNKSLDFSAKENDDVNVAQSYNNIGVVMVLQEKYKESLSFFTEAFQIHSALKSQGGIAKNYSNVSYVYGKLGNYSKAIDNAQKSYDIYAEMNNKGELSEITNRLSKLNEEIGNYKKALSLYKKHISYRDSVYNDKTTREITQKEMQFAFDKKLMTDSLTRVEAQKIKELEHQQQLKNKQTFIYGGGFILLIVLIFSVIIFKRLKQSNEQKVLIEKQKLIVDEKNKEITDSITYAKRIQTAILPAIDVIRKHLPNTFVYYQPKDIVAGDFYWFTKLNDKILIAAADCTGHGVPGAMVSVVCNNALNRAVNDFKLEDPALILDKTTQLVTAAFDKTDENVKDGMDISLCAINLKDNSLSFSGAINSLFYIRDNQLVEVKGDKQPVGQYASVKPFTEHQVSLEKGDQLYLFTDGFQDQFGGDKGKKFMQRRFKELLLSISAISIDKQREALQKEFISWKGDLDQLDDICVIGIEI